MSKIKCLNNFFVSFEYFACNGVTSEYMCSIIFFKFDNILPIFCSTHLKIKSNFFLFGIYHFNFH